MQIARRQLLKALGLGAVTGLDWRRTDPPADRSGPLRVVFFVQPHGHVRTNWQMPLPGAPTDRFAERALADLAPEDFSEVLRPLHPMREQVLAIEGLAQTTVLADLATIRREHLPDDNDHAVAVAHLLTASTALQRAGVPASGGAVSLDQELARRTAAPGRFGSRVYGYDYVPNSTTAPFSFVGPGQAAPVVADPATAFADLMGFARPPPTAVLTRDDRIRAMRGSVLDTAAREYEALAPRLGAEGRRRLDEHRDLIRELEAGLAAPDPARCALSFDGAGAAVTQFMRLIRMAFACDLTRVVTFVAPVPQAPEFGYPADAHVHGDYAHESIRGETACGTTYSLTAERAMTDLGAWYARHVAYLMTELAAVAEGSGTLLDHTLIVWLTELATGTHRHNDVCTVLAGGANDFFRTGRYVRYPQDVRNPLASDPHALIGPALNRLHVSVLQAMGQPDTSFGLTEATGADGSAISLRGALTELHRVG